MSKLDLSYFRAAFLLFLKTPITAKCQGNKLVTLSDKMFMSWTMLTEMNAGMPHSHSTKNNVEPM